MESDEREGVMIHMALQVVHYKLVKPVLFCFVFGCVYLHKSLCGWVSMTVESHLILSSLKPHRSVQILDKLLKMQTLVYLVTSH